MSGIEIAGIVLACLPLIFPALDVYKDSLRGAKRFFHPVKDIEKLIHKLLLQQVELKSLTRTTLVKAGADPGLIPEDDDEFAQLLLQNGDIQLMVADFFGPSSYILYDRAVKECVSVVKYLAQSLAEFLPVDVNGDLVEFIKVNKSRPQGPISVPQKVKIVLKKGDLDRSLMQLETSVNGLRRLTKIAANRSEYFEGSVTARSSKLVSTLRTARSRANSLYATLCRTWLCDKHPRHDASIILNGAEIVINNTAPKSLAQKGIVSQKFQLVFDGKLPDRFWHECTVEIIDDDLAAGTPVAGNSRAPTKSQITVISATALEVSSLCLTVRQAVTEKKLIHLYHLAQQRMYYDHNCAQTSAQPTGRIFTLDEVLSTAQGQASKMGYKERIFLALNLAASLLQLRGTPWIGGTWSGDRIAFAERTDSQVLTGKSQCWIDYAHPIIAHSFDSKKSPGTPAFTPLEPRKALLELGIMLLELWHEKSIESFTGEALPDDYHERLMLATKWLDDVHNEPLPKYQMAIEQCLRGVGVRRPDWDDVAFQKALCIDVLEKLMDCYEPFLSR